MPRKPNILVMSPEEMGGAALLSALRGSGCNVETVYNQMQAYARCLHDPPDLILCEALTPKAEGIHLVSRLARHEGTRNIPLIFITSLDQRQIEELLETVGGGYYILQPTSPEYVASDTMLFLVQRNRPDVHLAEPYRVLREYFPSAARRSSLRDPSPSAPVTSIGARPAGATPTPAAPSSPSVPTGRQTKSSNIHIQALLDKEGESEGFLSSSDLGLPPAEEKNVSSIVLRDASPASTPPPKPAPFRPTGTSSGSSGFKPQSFIVQPPSSEPDDSVEVEAAIERAGLSEGSASLRPEVQDNRSIDESLATHKAVAPLAETVPNPTHQSPSGVLLEAEDVRRLHTLVQTLTTACLQLRELLDRIESKSGK